MSYSGRVRYKSRRERNNLNNKRLKVILFFLLIGCIIYAAKNWVYITDYIRTYFY